MKKFLGFLFLLFVLVSIVYTSATIYVCENSSRINLKPIGINYECSCVKTNHKGMICEKIR